jgi:hypothetical protein
MRWLDVYLFDIHVGTHLRAVSVRAEYLLAWCMLWSGCCVGNTLSTSQMLGNAFSAIVLFALLSSKPSSTTPSLDPTAYTPESSTMSDDVEGHVSPAEVDDVEEPTDATPDAAEADQHDDAPPAATGDDASEQTATNPEPTNTVHTGVPLIAIEDFSEPVPVEEEDASASLLNSNTVHVTIEERTEAQNRIEMATTHLEHAKSEFEASRKHLATLQESSASKSDIAHAHTSLVSHGKRLQAAFKDVIEQQEIALARSKQELTRASADAAVAEQGTDTDTDTATHTDTHTDKLTSLRAHKEQAQDAVFDCEVALNKLNAEVCAHTLSMRLAFVFLNIVVSSCCVADSHTDGA